jgi:hypothetical protein
MDFIAVQNGFTMMSHKLCQQEMFISVCGFDYSDRSGGEDKESWFAPTVFSKNSILWTWKENIAKETGLRIGICEFISTTRTVLHYIFVSQFKIYICKNL